MYAGNRMYPVYTVSACPQAHPRPAVLAKGPWGLPWDLKAFKGGG